MFPLTARVRHARAALGSLKWRITLGTVAGLALGISVITALLVHRAEVDTLAAQRQRELGEAVRTASVLSRRVVDLQRALQAAASQLDPATLADEKRLGEYVRNQPVLRAMLTNVFVATAEGKVRVFFDADGIRPPDLRLGDRDYFRRTVAERRPIVSEGLPGRVSGDPVVVFTYPLQTGDGVFGVLGGALRLANRDLVADVADRHEGDTEALFIVTDARGGILAHPDRSRLLQTLVSEPRFATAYADWVAGGNAIEPSGLRLSQPGEVVSAAGVAGPDWMVWRVLPERELLAPLRAARHQALGWAAGLIVLVSLVTVALVNWLLAPLAQLERRAGRLFDIAQDPRQGWPEAPGEIGRLAAVLRQASVERAALERRTSEVMRKLESVMAAAPVGIAFTRARCFEVVSTEMCRMFGRTERELLGQPAQIIFASNEDYLALGPRVAEAFRTGQPYVGEWQMLRADGERFWAQLRGRPVDDGGDGGGTIWSINDVSREVAARDLLEWSATHDPLTGLANREAFEPRLSRLFEMLPHSIPAELIVVDLDHFKPINDAAGHAAGDAMLKEVAAAITACVRANDMVVRTGGDEFAVLLERCSHRAALRIAEAIQGAITRIALPWEGHALRVGASLGVASLGTEMSSPAAWLQAADVACYAAKAAGRGAVKAAQRSALRLVGLADPAAG